MAGLEGLPSGDGVVICAGLWGEWSRSREDEGILCRKNSSVSE